ncbi:hypothetical protein PLESTF_000702400 [Pleodorina starrii]|nr:hypothetical protein PLESTF_000702400 [Pleodorina starrii]
MELSATLLTRPPAPGPACAAKPGDDAGAAAAAAAPPPPAAAAAAGESPAPAGRPAGGSPAPGAPSGTPLSAAYSEDKGCRNTMEDVCVLQLDARPAEGQPPACRLAHFGIFDGHGGVSCASFAAQHLHARVLESGLLRKGLASPDGKADAKACKACIVEQQQQQQQQPPLSGCTPPPLPIGSAAAAASAVRYVG